MGLAIACETAGGTGVGPAVMRYCLMYGFGVTSGPSLAPDHRAQPFERGPHAVRTAIAAPLELALEIVAELLEVEPRGEQRDEHHGGGHAGDHADPRDPERGGGLAGAVRRLAGLDPRHGAASEDQSRDRAGQRDEEEGA